MKVGILGTGNVGQALGRAFLALGHEVMLAGRSATNDKAAAWVAEQGKGASQGSFEDAARFGDLIVLATLGSANEEALNQAGPENLAGKIVWDTTNPLDFSRGMPPSLFVGTTDSGGEQVQRQAPGAHVVKVFNTVGNALMFKPQLPGGPPDMFIGGNDADAKATTTALLTEFGWNTIDLGDITMSRHLEPMCLVWVISAMKGNHWNQAFKLLRA